MCIDESFVMIVDAVLDIRSKIAPIQGARAYECCHEFFGYGTVALTDNNLVTEAATMNCLGATMAKCF
jgi:hypothetical protein